MFYAVSPMPALTERMGRPNAAVLATADPADSPEDASNLIPCLQRIADDTNIHLRRRGIGLQYEVVQRQGAVYVAIFSRETREVIQLVPYTPLMRKVRRFTQISGLVLNQYA